MIKISDIKQSELIDAFNNPNIGIVGGQSDFINKFNDSNTKIEPMPTRPTLPNLPIFKPTINLGRPLLPSQPTQPGSLPERELGISPPQLNPNDPNSYGGWPTWKTNNPQGTLEQFKELILLPYTDPNAIHGGTGLPYEKKSGTLPPKIDWRGVPPGTAPPTEPLPQGSIGWFWYGGKWNPNYQRFPQ